VPTGPNQVWQLDFTEFETSTGGSWRLAGCRDHWSRYELGWHIAPTANQHDAIAAIELALVEAERLAGTPLVDLAARDEHGDVVPLVTIVPITAARSARFGSRRSSPHIPNCVTSAPGSAHPARTARVNAASGR
jgi:hypothetical protein